MKLPSYQVHMKHWYIDFEKENVARGDPYQRGVTKLPSYFVYHKNKNVHVPKMQHNTSKIFLRMLVALSFWLIGGLIGLIGVLICMVPKMCGMVPKSTAWCRKCAARCQTTKLSSPHITFGTLSFEKKT